MKHYSMRGRSVKEKMRPWLFFDVKFDIRDMRSRISETLERSFQAQMLRLEEDLIWTPDMVIEREVDFLKTRAEEIVVPAGFDGTVIDGRDAENKFLEYLLRHYKIMALWNTVYDLYSTPFEPIEDFQLRCRDRALEEMTEDFRSLCERYLRRLWQLEESILRAAEELDSDIEKLSQLKLELGRIFLELKEDISAIFLELEFTDRIPRFIICEPVPAVLDLNEKLSAFQKELYAELTELKQNYHQRAESIEPFQLALTLHQIDIAGSAIFWQ